MSADEPHERVARESEAHQGVSKNSAWLHRAVPTHVNRAAALRDEWLHDIKHDGFRVIARKCGCRDVRAGAGLGG